MLRPPRPGGLDAIEHVVVLMQENRSFDHYFGTMPGVRGFQDRNAVDLPGGGSVLRQPYGTSARGPERLPDDWTGDSSTRHDWTSGHQAWNRGWHDRWIQAKGMATMGYYGRAGVPLHREVAEAFTVCDAYHCSILSETTSNRNYLFSGYTGYEPDGARQRVIGADAHSRENRPAGYEWADYPGLLEAAGKTWRVYQEWDNFYDNNLEFFTAFKQVFRQVLHVAFPGGDYRSLYDFFAKVQTVESAVEREHLLFLLDVGADQLAPKERRLYDRGLRRQPGWAATTHGFIKAFRDDALNGSLPQVSYLVAPAALSEHPGDSLPRHGESLLYQVIDAIATNPEVWDSTVLFVSYDENDGLFDHVPPPVPPDEVEDEFVDGQPLGLGIRVPMVAVSPWTVGGYVCSQVFDHSSQVQFLERWLGVHQPRIGAWRRTVAGDLTSIFDFDRTGPVPPAPTGVRRARPLPYRPEAQAVPDAEHQRLVLTMANAGEESVHLALYPYKGEYDCPRHFDIAGGSGHATTVDVPVRDRGGSYSCTLTGPNGWRREFAGTLSGAAAGAVVSLETDEEQRHLAVCVRNCGASELVLSLRAEHYPLGGQRAQRQCTVRPGRKAVLDWDTSAAEGWYDLVLTAAGDPAFRRRLMGHIENGRESIAG